MTEPTLADWLLQQIAADEQEARYSDSVEAGDPLDSEIGLDVDCRSLLVDGTRLLAECDAKRRIVADHGFYAGWCGWSQDNGTHDGEACDTLRFLALPYADREGYREEWRP